MEDENIYSEYDEGVETENGDIQLGPGIVMRGGPGVAVMSGDEFLKTFAGGRMSAPGKGKASKKKPKKSQEPSPSLWDHLDD